MKIQLVKLALTSIVIGFAGATSAHTISETFAATTNAVDVYNLSCIDDGSGDPDRAVAQVQKTLNAGTLRVTLSGLFDGVTTGTNVSATDGTVNGAASAWIQQAGANNGDEYAVVVSHSSATANNYDVTAHCEINTGALGSGTETGGELTLESDQ